MRIHQPDLVQDIPHAVLLDLDNTVYAYEEADHAAREALQAKVTNSFQVSTSEFEDAYEKARQDVKARLPGVAAAHNRLLYIQRMCELIGLGSQPLLALDLEQTYWRTFLNNAHLFDGVKDFLYGLRKIGIPSCFVTDLTSQIQFRKLVFFELDRLVNFVVTSEESGADKPRTNSFSLALEKLKPSGGVVWMVGDSLTSDIHGASEAVNAITFQKTHEGVVTGRGAKRANVEFSNFRELSGLLQGLLKGSE